MKKLTILAAATLLLTSTAYAQRPFEKLDVDNDGKLSKEEFLHKIKPENVEGMTKSFGKRDKDGDGFLTPEEFRQKSKK